MKTIYSYDLADVGSRKGLIGSSDLATLFGCGFLTQHQLWDHYMNGTQEKLDQKTEEMFAIGHMVEHVIARIVAERYGVRIIRDNKRHFRTDMPWLGCHPDREVVGLVDGKKVYCEFKSSAFSTEWGKPDTDQIPKKYIPQCMAYFITLPKCDEVWVCRLHNNAVDRYIVRPNQALMDTIVRKASEWKKKVDAGWIPSPETDQEASSFFNHPTEECVEANPVLLEKVEKRARLKADIKELEKELQPLELELKNAMGNSSYIVSTNNEGKQTTLCSWKAQERTSFDLDAFIKANPGIDLNPYYKTTQTRVFR